MAIRKYQVFLASRFDEFQILRLALKNQLNGLKEPPIEAVDLNDDMADTRPPLSRSYYAVDNSELFVLLVGDTYGGRPPNSEESYTHLEYRRALTSKKPILPFTIRNLSDSAPQERQIDDRRLQEWVKEIRKNHTPSYLDVSSGWDQLTATIFEQIRERLVEFYLDGEFGVLEATGDQSELILEESIIKRELLASAPRRSFDEVDGKQLLKRFANENAQEALKALELRLPQIAIHHLHKAVDMVPLDLVLGYWLSRLLVATGRQKSCEEGRRIALRCAQVSTSSTEELGVETMACLIIAARASERIGEFEVGLEYSRQAHEKVPYHWLSKLEYGRQLALAGEKDAAFKHVEEAFWLRPESINKVQTDPAFHRFGRDFSDFRAKLRQTVIEEVNEIYQIESVVRDFSVSLGIVVHMGSDYESIGSLSEGKQPITQMVRAANRSMKSTLTSLQCCALKLATDNDSFVFNSAKGLTPETRMLIEEEIARRRSDVGTLSQQVAMGSQKEERLKQVRLSVVVGTIVASLLLTAIATVAAFAEATAIVVLTIILIVVAVLVAWALYQSIGLRLDTVKTTNASCDSHLNQAKVSLEELEATQRRFVASESRLRMNVAGFAKLINRYELNGLKRIPFSPAPPIDRKGRDDLARVDTTKIGTLGLTTDAELLPAPLHFFSLPLGPQAKYWLAKRVNSGGTETWSRSAAYFQPTPVNNIYIHKDGQQSGPFTFAQIRARLKDGQLQATDHAWHEGVSEWTTLSGIPGL